MTSEQPTPIVRPRPRRRAPEPAQEPAPNGHAEARTPLTDLPEFKTYRHAREDLEVARKALQGRWGHVYPATDEWMRQVSAAVSVETLGLGYAATATEAVRLQLSRLREVRGELTCELSVSRWGQHLYQARFNLSSGQARSTTAKLLASHPFGGKFAAGEAPDWREILEQLSVRVLELERAGEAFERVGQRPIQPAPPRVIDPYLPAGPTLLWAPQGVGKSTMAAAVAVTLEAYAEVIPGWHPKVQTHVLVLDWEASSSEWNDRIARIAAGLEDEPPSILYRRPRRPLADMVEDVSATVDRDSIGFLIIDSVEKAAGARAEGSTYEEKAERLFLAIDRIGVPCLLIDHVTGEDLRHGQAKVTPKSIGSVLKGAWARATYDLKRDPETSTEAEVQMLLTNVKVNDARRERPFEFAIRYEGDPSTGPIRFVRSRLDSPELLATLPLPDQVWRCLAREGRAMPVKELAEAVDSTPGSIRDALSKDARRQHPRFVRLPDNSIAIRAEEAG